MPSLLTFLRGVFRSKWNWSDPDSAVRATRVRELLAELRRRREIPIGWDRPDSSHDKRRSRFRALISAIWMDGDANVRKTLAEMADEYSMDTVLETMASNDVDAGVRSAATLRLRSEWALVAIATTDDRDSVRGAALQRLSELGEGWFSAAASAEAKNRRRYLENAESYFRAIAQIAISTPSASVRLAAIKVLMDEKLLTQIAQNDSDETVRGLAAERLEQVRSWAEKAKCPACGKGAGCEGWEIDHGGEWSETTFMLSCRHCGRVDTKRYVDDYPFHKVWSCPFCNRILGQHWHDGTLRRLSGK